MNSQDQETKILFAIAGIVVAIYGVFTFAVKIYRYLCVADPQGIGLLFILVSILFIWLYGVPRSPGDLHHEPPHPRGIAGEGHGDRRTRGYRHDERLPPARRVASSHTGGLLPEMK